MATNQHQNPSAEAASRAKKARRLADDNIMARQLAEFLENPRKNTIQADNRSLKNYQHSPLLKLPQEILDRIYRYVFDDQALRLTIVKGRIGLLYATNAHPLGLLLACRKTYQDNKGQTIYARVILRIVTFEYISLLESWEHPIISDVQAFLDVLKASPPVDHFEITGVRCSGSGRHEKYDHLEMQGDYDLSIDYRAELKKILMGVYPNAMYGFRAVDEFD